MLSAGKNLLRIVKNGHQLRRRKEAQTITNHLCFCDSLWLRSNLVQQVDQMRFILVDDNNLLRKLLILGEERLQALFLR